MLRGSGTPGHTCRVSSLSSAALTLSSVSCEGGRTISPSSRSSPQTREITAVKDLPHTHRQLPSTFGSITSLPMARTAHMARTHLLLTRSTRFVTMRISRPLSSCNQLRTTRLYRSSVATIPQESLSVGADTWPIKILTHLCKCQNTTG